MSCAKTITFEDDVYDELRKLQKQKQESRTSKILDVILRKRFNLPAKEDANV